MSTSKREVRLWNSAGVLAIILAESGVIYTNQTCGHACYHPQAEGILVPFNNWFSQGEESIEYRLSQLLLNAPWLTPELADAVDSILANSVNTACAKVDRDRLADSHEAWVYVDIDETLDCLFTGFGRCKAILTWLNSD